MSRDPKGYDPNAGLARTFVPRHATLGPLAARAADLIELRRLFRTNIPPGLAEAAQLANFREGTIIVMAENSAVAAKLKQLTPRLTTLFREKGWQVNAIRIQLQGAA